MWNLVADSSCDLFDRDWGNGNITLTTIPFYIYVGETAFTDNTDMDIPAMLDANQQVGMVSHTSCPSPQSWHDAFKCEGNTIAFTISSGLSGSCSSAHTAMLMALEENPDRKIAVIDSLSTGPEIIQLIHDAVSMIESGMEFEAVVSDLRRRAEEYRIIFALSSYNNLIRAGRVGRIVGFLAGHLGIWGIGSGSADGTIHMMGKARGEKRMISHLAGEICRAGQGVRRIVICHCMNETAAICLKKALIEKQGPVEVEIYPTRGLDSYYAESHGLIVSY